MLTWKGLSAAALCVSMRAASSSVAMSASMNWMASYSAIGLPNVCLDCAWRSASSSAAWPMPSACAAMATRPPSSDHIATLKPSFAAPTTCPAGTRTSAKARSMHPRPRTPSESALAVRSMPGVLIGTRNAVMPCARMPGRVAANTSSTLAPSALATQVFRPVRL